MNISDVNTRMNNQSLMPRSTEEKGGIRYDADFSRIEELIEGNTFSREEINHFLEILNSRVDNELEKQIPSNNAGGDTQLVSRMHEFRRTPSEEEQQDTDRTMIGTFDEKSDAQVRVSASPIDIARAYMAGRTSEGGHNIYGVTSKGERAEPSNEFARKPFLPSPPPKQSICWPGTIVHDHGYATPQSQRGRYRLHDFPRTPYSRTTLSKSTTMLQTDSGRASTLTPFQQSQTSIYGQAKLRADTIDVYGSVGPIRRIRNKFASEVRPRGSIFLSSPKDTPSKRGTTKVLGGLLPGGENNFEPGETSAAYKYWSGDNVLGSSGGGISNQNISSSQAVRKILEHLDRTKPTPKEKEAELKLVTAWRRSPPQAADNIHDETIGSRHAGELASHKNSDMAGPKFPVEFNKSSSTSKFLVNFPDKGTDEAKDAVGGNTRASGAVFTGSSIIPGSSALSPFSLKGTSDPVVKKSNENALATTSHRQTQSSWQFPPPHPSNGQVEKTVADPTGFEFSKTHGTKTSLPSISINKPDFRSVSSDNGRGFTFPVSASLGVLSEPPTPSITPSSSSSILSQPISTSTIPSYTFGSNKSTPRLIFSFPPSGNASTHDDSDLKFSFGSDNKARLSFSSIGRDTICY